MNSPTDQPEGSKTRRGTGRIIVSGSAGRVPLTPTHSVDEIPFVPAFDLLEKEPAGTFNSEEVAAIAAALWLETTPRDSQSGGSERWTSASRLQAVSRRL